MTHTEMAKKSPDTDMSQEENLGEKDLTLGVVLPGGIEKTATIHGSKPVMDLLVILCAKYHLNPSNHTIELISTDGNHIKLKPNAVIETLEIKKILIKPKGMVDDNNKRSPSMPEATVRLVINYKKTHKTVLRVSPQVPVGELMAAICAKCELDQSTTVLRRNPCSEEPLDLAKSLNDFGLREVYAVDSNGVNSDELPASPRLEEDKSLSSKEKVLKEKENKGLFSIFRRRKKKPDQVCSASAPASPVLAKDRPGSLTSLNGHASTRSSNDGLSVTSKKRRAPLPPMMVSQSFLSNLSDQQTDSQPHDKPIKDQESGIDHRSLKGSKRKAPPPPMLPCISTPEETTQDKSIKVTALSNLEEIGELEETVATADPDFSAVCVSKENGDSLSVSTDVPKDSGKAELTSPPVDMETQDTSLKQGKGEDQPELDPNSNECTQETLEVEETCTSDLEIKAGYRNEMVMSKEEHHLRERLAALPEESPAHQCHNGGKSAPSFVADEELKMEPPTELARQYVPRPGLTTYTIVPSKSLEKLKYFEVELTLVEDPAVALKENEAVGSPKPANHDSDEPQVSVGQPECFMTQGEELSNRTVTNENAHCGHMAPTLLAPAGVPEAEENCQPSSSYDRAFEAGPDQETKEKKVPPAIKPKPDFHNLPQQTCVEYVTSAVTKNNARAISHCGQGEESGTAGKEEPIGAKEESFFPPPPSYAPPPPPLPSQAGQEASERQREDEVKSKGIIGPGDGETKHITSGLEQPEEPSLKQLTSLATPNPYEPAEPSPFCKAVFAAIKRSQSFAPPTQPPDSETLLSGTVRMSADGEK
ncbi:cordon-bleu protein-like 1 isoform X1 [Anguilla anguilla]|uniref:cordon-bleu protein-like 1 isoform X1 n=1 Tax=Anguilla anguilla TaxID=7936 RepID=UPI0015AEB481|nr:cordon-bleu protein-like 1 isoform X1 [Anguilla anguilla]XP_035248467.1 cordon-bleu protein-like 1 isoform X1 [Anguilla anguilla]